MFLPDPWVGLAIGLPLMAIHWWALWRLYKKPADPEETP